MRINELSIGTKLRLELPNYILGDTENIISSKIVHTINETDLLIDSPTVAGKRISFVQGDIIKAYFFIEDIVYSFKVSFIDYYAYNNTRLMKVKAISSIQDIQRRNYFRLSCIIPVKIALTSAKDNPNRITVSYMWTIASDLSGGGMRVNINEGFEKGDKVECIITIDEKELVVHGQVVWKSRHETSTKYSHQIGIEFEFIQKSVQEQIIRFIFNEQRKLMHREEIFSHKDGGVFKYGHK